MSGSIDFFDKIEETLQGFISFIIKCIITLRDLALLPIKIYSDNPERPSSPYVRPFTFLALTTFSFVKIIRIFIVMILLILVSIDVGCHNGNFRETWQSVDVPAIGRFLTFPSISDFLITSLPLLALLLVFSYITCRILYKKPYTFQKSTFLEMSCYAIGFQHTVLIILSCILLPALFCAEYANGTLYYVVFSTVLLAMSGILIWQLSATFTLPEQTVSNGENILNKPRIIRLLLSVLFFTTVCLVMFPIAHHVGGRLGVEGSTIYLFDVVIVIAIIWPFHIFQMIQQQIRHRLAPRFSSPLLNNGILAVMSFILCASSLLWCSYISYRLAQSDLGDSADKKPVLRAVQIRKAATDSSHVTLSLLLTNNLTGTIHLSTDSIVYAAGKQPQRLLTGTSRANSRDSTLVLAVDAQSSLPVTIRLKKTEKEVYAQIDSSANGLVGFTRVYTDGTKGKVFAIVQ